MASCMFFLQRKTKKSWPVVQSDLIGSLLIMTSTELSDIMVNASFVKKHILQSDPMDGKIGQLVKKKKCICRLNLDIHILLKILQQLLGLAGEETELYKRLSTIYKSLCDTMDTYCVFVTSLSWTLTYKVCAFSC